MHHPRMNQMKQSLKNSKNIGWKNIRLDLVSDISYEIFDNQLSESQQIIFLLLCNKMDLSKEVITHWTSLNYRMIALVTNTIDQDEKSLEILMNRQLRQVSKAWKDLHLVASDAYFKHLKHLTSKHTFKSIYVMTQKSIDDVMIDISLPSNVPLLINLISQNKEDLNSQNFLPSSNQNQILVSIVSSKPFMLSKDKLSFIHEIFKYTSLFQDIAYVGHTP